MSELVKVWRVYCCDECGRVTGDENPWRYEDDFSGPWCQPSCKRLVAVPVVPLDAVKRVVEAAQDALVILAALKLSVQWELAPEVMAEIEKTEPRLRAVLVAFAAAEVHVTENVQPRVVIDLEDAVEACAVALRETHERGFPMGERTPEQERVIERFPHGASFYRLQNGQERCVRVYDERVAARAAYDSSYKSLASLLADEAFCTEYGAEE